MTSNMPYAEVIGDPIAHSKSPLIHKFWLKKLGIEADYRATKVTLSDLPSYFAERRRDRDWVGCNVTMPLKVAVLDHVDAVDPSADGVAAANIIRPTPAGLIAANSDVTGIMGALGRRLMKRPVLLIGSGGAARSTLRLLENVGAKHITLLARNFVMAAELAKQYGVGGSFLPLNRDEPLPAAGLLVNASSLGMRGNDDFSPMQLSGLKNYPENAVVFDMVYNPVRTLLLEQAAFDGLETVSGLLMLIEQARSAFRTFFGLPPSDEIVDELRAMLTA